MSNQIASIIALIILMIALILLALLINGAFIHANPEAFSSMPFADEAHRFYHFVLQKPLP